MVIVALAGAHYDRLGPLVTAYVLILAVAGPLVTHLVRPSRQRHAAAPGGPTESRP